MQGVGHVEIGVASEAAKMAQGRRVAMPGLERGRIEGFRWAGVQEVNRRIHCLRPEVGRKLGLQQHGASLLHDVANLPVAYTILVLHVPR